MKQKLITLLALVVILSACGKKDSKQKLEELKKQKSSIEAEIKKLEAELKPSNGQDGKSKLITVDDVKRGALEHFIEVQGTVNSDENTWVTSTGGIVTKVYVKEGDVVRAGQLLASTDANALLKGIEEAKNGLSLATTVYEKQKRLWDQNIGSEIQYLQAKNAMEGAQKSIERLEAQLSLTQMKSPINGVIDQIMVREGEIAAPGTPYSGIRIVNLNKLYAEAKISDSELGKIKKGNPVKIVLNSVGKELNAPVTHVSRVVDPQSRTFMIQVALSPNEDIYPNMAVKLNIKDAVYENVIVVPSNLLQKTESGVFIYVAENENGKWIAKQKEVREGLSYNGSSIIESGLVEGDKLITFGYSELSDGQTIKF